MKSFPNNFIGQKIKEICIEDGSTFEAICVAKDNLVKTHNIDEKKSIIIYESSSDWDGCIESYLTAYEVRIPGLSDYQTEMFNIIKDNESSLVSELKENTLSVLLRFEYVIRTNDYKSVIVNPQIIKYL